MLEKWGLWQQIHNTVNLSGPNLHNCFLGLHCRCGNTRNTQNPVFSGFSIKHGRHFNRLGSSPSEKPSASKIHKHEIRYQNIQLHFTKISLLCYSSNSLPFFTFLKTLNMSHQLPFSKPALVPLRPAGWAKIIFGPIWPDLLCSGTRSRQTCERLHLFQSFSLSPWQATPWFYLERMAEIRIEGLLAAKQVT